MVMKDELTRQKNGKPDHQSDLQKPHAHAVLAYDEGRAFPVWNMYQEWEL